MRLTDAPALLLRCTGDDGHATESSLQQSSTENSILDIYEAVLRNGTMPVLRADKHAQFLMQSLDGLSQKFTSLDASRPWLVFWITQSLDLLGRLEMTTIGKEKQDAVPSQGEQLRLRVASTLLRCQHPQLGGFGGNPGQLPHLAPTFAAVLSLAVAAVEDAWRAVDRSRMYAFLMSVKQPDGSFIMHTGGETDVRGTYCALVVAHLLNIVTPELVRNCADFVQRRQMAMEGGFQGRPNKLVDGCYSFWVGGLFPLLRAARSRQAPAADATGGDYLYDREMLQEYLLHCCQAKRGGLRDKPEKSQDHYHTCYDLTGLALAQNYTVNRDDQEADGATEYRVAWYADDTQRVTLVDGENERLPAVHPVFQVRLERVVAVQDYFREPLSHSNA
ncbi:CAAX farnesyltransferase (FTase) subunit beta [Sorochytrium milnesiophthora]